MNEYAVVDIFCGVGGLTHGFVLEKFHVVAGLDSDKSCQFAYEANNNGTKFISKRVEELEPGEITQFFPKDKKRILIGCAPCQPFSSNNVKRPETDKWKLLDTFADLVEEVNPDVLSMENVLQLKTFNEGDVYRHFVDRIRGLGYTVTAFRAYCPDYGVPQKRRRLVMFGSKYGSVSLVPGAYTPKHYRSVQWAIEKLDRIDAGEASTDDPLHTSRNLTTINLSRIKASQPGGSWHDWPDNLRLDCHKQGKGKTALSVYGRMKWEEPAPTLTTQFFNLGSGRFGHPSQNRAISLREGALLQSFPHEYRFVESNQDINFAKLGRQIGNAVPVKLGRAIAKSIRRHLTIYA